MNVFIFLSVLVCSVVSSVAMKEDPTASSSDIPVEIVAPAHLSESVDVPLLKHEKSCLNVSQSFEKKSALGSAVMHFDKGIVWVAQGMSDMRLLGSVVIVGAVWGIYRLVSHTTTQNTLAPFWKKRYLKAFDSEMLAWKGWFINDLLLWLDATQLSLRRGEKPLSLEDHGFDPAVCFDVRFSDLSVAQQRFLREYIQAVLRRSDEYLKRLCTNQEPYEQREYSRLSFIAFINRIHRYLTQYALKPADCQCIKRFLKRL